METLCKIRDVYRAIAEFEVQFTQMYDLSLNEGMLLCTLLNTPKLTSSEIAEALGLSASNTSKVIRSVEGKKLITRLMQEVNILRTRYLFFVGHVINFLHDMLLVSCIACYKLFVSVRVYFYLLLLRNLLRIFNNVSFDNFLTLNQFFSLF